LRDKANRPSFTLEVAKEFYDGPDSKHRAKAVKQLKGKTNRTPGFDSPGASTIATKKRDEVVLWKWVMRKLDVSPEQVQDFGACRIPSERGLNASTRRQVARALRAAAHALASASSDDIQEGDTVRFLKDTTRKNGIVLKSGEIGRVVSPVSATSFMLQIKGWREKFKMKTSDLGTVVEKINAVTEASATVSAAARNEIAYLKKYLSLSDEDKARDLAYNSPTSLREWADNTGIELVADPEEDPETAINGLSRLERRHWLEWISNYLMRYDPVMAPAYLTLSFERFFRNEWLVHFTDHGHDVVDEGFTRGVDDMAEIALTRLIRDNAKTRPGYVFAFMADDVPRDGAEKYGSQVVLFQGTGVLAYHSGDEESQAIVWGKSAYNLTLLEKNVYEDTWYVAGKYGDSVYTSRKDGHEGLKEVIAWVQNNRNQYRRLLRAGG